jgi:hypothetical protein
VKFKIDTPEDLDRIMVMAAHAEPDRIEELMELLKRCDKGVCVEVSRHRDSRSRSQEGYYRKWARAFGEFVGLTEEEMHDELLCRCFGSTIVATKFGDRRRPAKRSADTNTETYGMLIEQLIIVAGEMGFSIPPPLRNANGNYNQV